MLPGNPVANREIIIQEASRIMGRQYVDFSKPKYASKSYKKVGLQVGWAHLIIEKTIVKTIPCITS